MLNCLNTHLLVLLLPLVAVAADAVLLLLPFIMWLAMQRMQVRE